MKRNNESSSKFIQRFREVRSHCYSLNLSDGQLAELALQGMSPLIKENFDGQEFESLVHLVQKVSAFENQHCALRKEKYLKGTAAMTDPYNANSDGDDPEIMIAEQTWGKAPVSYPWVKETKNTYDFDVKKADRIFDLLLEKKQLRLPTNHVIPLAEELKGKKYYKFHNATNHSTNKCRIFCFHIQKAIEQGKIKFKPAKKLTMDIDKHPFPGVHMIEFRLSKGKTKVLMSAKAKEDGSVDPNVQVSANEYEEAKK